RKTKTATSPFIFGGAAIFTPQKMGNLQGIVKAKTWNCRIVGDGVTGRALRARRIAGRTGSPLTKLCGAF
ncbi:MAG: hypothetical protein MJ249_17255, partial [Kiritimatiellae bacterium]|nr:hypothetical protein [Kiritimatiellia bacterium]